MDLTDESVLPRKRSKAWDVILWIIIALLAVAVVLRGFVLSRVAVSGSSMTANYYNSEQSEHYNPDLTFHDKQRVLVNRLAKPSRGDVVVFYKNAVKSKFLGVFAGGDSIEQGGEYYKLIKRVVALGGDKLWLESDGLAEGNYRLVIQTPDGDILREDSYIKNKVTLDADCFILSVNDTKGLGRLAGLTQDNPLVIDEGYFFAIGDNRYNSDDSRYDLGQVPLSQIFGIVIQ